MHDVEFSKRLRRQIGHWQDDGLIDAELAERLLAHSNAPDGPVRGPFAIVLAFLGALLIGIGVIVFVASNWSVIPGNVKLLGLFVAMGLSYWGGYRLRYVGNTYPGTGNALIFLGALLYGASLFLVAQAMHINAGAPSLLVLWALGVLPLGWILKYRALKLLGLWVLTLALGWEAVFWTEAIGGFCSIFLLWGALLIALGRLAPSLLEDSEGLGVFVILTALSVLATFGPGEDRAEWGLLPPGGQLRWVMLTVATMLVTLVHLARAQSRSIERREGWGLLGLELVAVFVMLGGALEADPVRFGLNIVLLAVLVGVLWLGYERRNAGWVQFALIFFGLDVFCRYAELWSHMPTEIFFLSAGIVLLGGGIALERVRRRLLVGLKDKEQDYE